LIALSPSEQALGRTAPVAVRESGEEIELATMGSETFLEILLAILLPPLGVFLRFGIGVSYQTIQRFQGVYVMIDILI
jgi:hypothetical protein